MRVLDLTFDRPALNLAFDEALLEAAEAGGTPETLWFWESPVPFVVLGVSQVLADHVDEPACGRDAIPVHRRCSAGGCVFQGPGCLNYTVVLSYDRDPGLRAIRASYGYILGRVAASLAAHGIDAVHRGISDLAVGDLKFSGNAQRRRKSYLLHHGTLLHAFDLGLIAQYLREPEDRPDYRGDRPHARFVRNIPLAADTLRTALRQAFDVGGAIDAPTAQELDRARQLADEKYDTDAWRRRR